MLAVPKKETFQENSKLSYEHLDQLCASLNMFREPLWQYYKDKKLDELP